MTELHSLFNSFNLLLDAPNSIQSMRELILQLAVQGKLVPQNPNDEPASELLRKIKAKKEKLIKENRIKNGKPLPPVQSAEIPYELPKGWEWVRLREICSYIQRGKSPKYSEMKKYPVIAQKCIQWSGIEMYKAKFLDPETIEKYNEERFIKTDDLLWNSTGVGTLGRMNIYNENVNKYEFAVADSHVTVIRPFRQNISSKYLLHWFAGPIVQNEINDRATGSTKQTELATTTVKEYVVPLPPFPEQKRIVAKVDQLMKLCDELEVKQQEVAKNRNALNDIALDKLATSNNSDFSNQWAFVHDNFDLLYSVPENVTKLRQTILQLAVQGKLVPQDPNDEPASELLKKIKTEKKQLVKENKIKKEKPFPPIRPEEIPYKLPNGWEWVRLEAISQNIHYGYTASADETSKDIRLLRITDIQSDKVNWDTVPGCIINEKVYGSYALNDGDVLIARTGGTIGKTYLVKNLSVKAVFASYLIRVIPLSHILPYFIKLFTGSPLYWDQLYEKSMGTGQPNVNGVSLKSLLVPLPSFKEQKCIVAKVDQLMKLCDDLESSLHQSQKDSEMLMQAVLQKAFA